MEPTTDFTTAIITAFVMGEVDKKTAKCIHFTRVMCDEIPGLTPSKVFEKCMEKTK